MRRRTASRNLARRRAGSAPATWLVAAVLVVVLLGSASGLPLAPKPALAAVARWSVLEIAPGPGDVPGFRLDRSDELGGDLEPVLLVERTFAGLDGDRRLDVRVSIGTSAADAQDSLDDRANQLIWYHGWRVFSSQALGDGGYQGSVASRDGRAASAVLFRVNAIAAEVRLEASQGSLDPGVVDGVARLVESRMLAQPDLLAAQPGFGTPGPATLPGKDPPGAPVGVVAGVAGAAPPGGAVIGSSTGSPVTSDTVVNLTVSNLERPWSALGIAPVPASGMDYLTVAVQVDVVGQSAVQLALTDFAVTTVDGRVWSPVAGRQPGLRLGTVTQGSPATGWLSFRIPTTQQPLQLLWRLRTTQSLENQGGTDQTLVVPLAAGAMASASIGTSAPPAEIPVVPIPGPLGPVGPTGPSGGGDGSNIGRPRPQ